MHKGPARGSRLRAVYTALLQQALDGNLGKLLTKGQSHEMFPLSSSHLITEEEQLFLSGQYFLPTTPFFVFFSRIFSKFQLSFLGYSFLLSCSSAIILILISLVSLHWPELV